MNKEDIKDGMLVYHTLRQKFGRLTSTDTINIDNDVGGLTVEAAIVNIDSDGNEVRYSVPGSWYVDRLIKVCPETPENILLIRLKHTK